MRRGLSCSTDARRGPATLEQSDHIVDVLIHERAPRLSRSLIWPLVRPPLHGFHPLVQRLEALAQPLFHAIHLGHSHVLFRAPVTSRRPSIARTVPD